MKAGRGAGGQLELLLSPHEGRQLVFACMLTFFTAQARRKRRKRDPAAPIAVKVPLYKMVRPPNRRVRIGGKTIVAKMGAHRTRLASVKDRFLHWRVIPLHKGYSLGTDPLTKHDRAVSRRLKIHENPELPKTRGDCVNGPRPCLVYRCRHNLGLDVHPESGSVKVNFPGMDPAELEDTCSLDVADRYEADGGTTLEHVGLLMGLTLERTRQIEQNALLDMRAKLGSDDPLLHALELDLADDDDDDDDPDLDLRCGECGSTEPLGIVDVAPPAVEVLSGPMGAWGDRCIIAGANRPQPTWWFCPTTGWYEAPGQFRVHVERRAHR